MYTNPIFVKRTDLLMTSPYLAQVPKSIQNFSDPPFLMINATGEEYEEMYGPKKPLYNFL